MKVKFIAAALLAALVTFGITACSEKTEATPGKQVDCPIMKGNKIDPNLYVDVEGKRIYVCCPGCIAPIKADPAKYIKQMEADGITLEKAPKQQEAVQ